ncbi:MAG TPA: 4a-hydroxytetrahydrobiopterin dehydratase [Candidatus Acidoferrales bacterium]|nr:4a-hydroxytetrahydrobiopterin dehydratase [Candidatus Acidoferrales bacterium]
MSELAKKKCVPCEGSVPPLQEPQVESYLAQLPGWSLAGKWITKEFSFEDFAAAMKFVDKVAVIAEAEGHHPDIHIHYNRVRFDIWTHAIDGLSENDFILAAKIDAASG